MLIYMLFTILLLGGLFSLNLYQKLNMQEQYYTALKKNIRQIFKDTFPQTQHMVRGQELAQMSQKIEEEMGRYGWLDELVGKGTVLDVLKILTKTISGYHDVRIDNISVEGKVINLDGRTSSFETVDKLKEKLSNTGFLKTVKLVGAKMDKRERAVTFKIAMEKFQ